MLSRSSPTISSRQNDSASPSLSSGNVFCKHKAVVVALRGGCGGGCGGGGGGGGGAGAAHLERGARAQAGGRVVVAGGAQPGGQQAAQLRRELAAEARGERGVASLRRQTRAYQLPT